MSSSRTHYCYICKRTVGLLAESALCASCHQGFVLDLNTTLVPSLLPSDQNDDEIDIGNNDQRPGFLEGLHGFVRERVSSSNHGSNSTMRQEQTRENSGFNDIIPRLIFSGQVPWDYEFEEILSESNGFVRGNNGNYFTGPGFAAEISSRNERQGTPPTPRPLIDLLPTIKISKKDIENDSHCAICKDKFKLKSRARKMPCDHIYHSDCIVPWLAQHNSCPICRKEISQQEIPRQGISPNDVMNHDCSRRSRTWNPLSLFRSSGPSRNSRRR